MSVERETSSSEDLNETEDVGASAVAPESVSNATGGTEMVAGTSLRERLSEAQNNQSGGPTHTGGDRWPSTASKSGGTKSTPFPRRMPSTQTRNTPVMVPGQPSAESQGDVQAFQRSGETPHSSGLIASQVHARFLPSIQEQVDQNQCKTGICILSACTNAWCTEECIKPSDAVERMRECFEDKLGYLVIQVGTTITSQHLDEVLQELSVVKLPSSYHRIFFYYFGHGTENSLCLADKNVERKHIISQLQSMCPSHPVELFKIFLFDSCRTVSPSTTDPIQEHIRGIAGDLGGGSGQTWQTKHKFPSSTNTLVINATDFNCKAYYIDDKQIHGCGLVTLYFTQLAPVMNSSLSEVLAEVRKKVDTYIESHPDSVQQCNGHQVLVYEDRLMGIVNLLVESTGKARVTPKVVTASAQALNTNVQWSFGLNVEHRIKTFIVEVTVDGGGRRVGIPAPVPTKPKERFATLSSLRPNTTYHVKVIAKYKDDVCAESEKYTFTTLDRSSPQNVKITSHYPASQEATVEWLFPNDVSDLSHYIVKAVTKEERTVEKIINDVQDKAAILKPIYLSSKYTVTVTAVYWDGVETESCTVAEFFSECDLRAATNVSATVIHLHDPLKVEVKWSHKRIENAPFPSDFMVVAKAGNSSSLKVERVGDPHIHQAALELSHDTTYSLKVITIYGENTKLDSEAVDFKTPSKDEEKPKIGDAESIQKNSVEITFSDPPFLKNMEYGDWIQLSGYTVTCRPYGQEERNAKSSIISYNVNSPTSDASPVQPHRMKLAGLMPGKKYKLTVTAHYSNGESTSSEERVFTTKSSGLPVTTLPVTCTLKLKCEQP